MGAFMPYTGPKSEMDPLALAVRDALKCASIVMHDDEFYDELVKHGGVIFQGKKPVIAHLNKGKFKPYGFYIIFPENKGYTYLEAEDLKRGYAIVDGKKIECPLRRNASTVLETVADKMRLSALKSAFDDYTTSKHKESIKTLVAEKQINVSEVNRVCLIIKNKTDILMNANTEYDRNSAYYAIKMQLDNLKNLLGIQ